MGEVGHLVDDYVFHERRLQHHGSPVEPQRAVGGAASPPKGDDVMPIQIVEQSTDLLHYYGVIPVSFTVDSQYRVDAIDRGLGGWRLTEERVEPTYVKDYDNKEDGQPTLRHLCFSPFPACLRLYSPSEL